MCGTSMAITTNAIRQQQADRRARRWHGLLVLGSVACSSRIETPSPPSDSLGGTPLVVGLVYGSVRHATGTAPFPQTRLRVYAFKGQCRSTNSDTVLGGTDSTGHYRYFLEVVGTPGQGCLSARFYHDRQGVPDSVVVTDVLLDMKAAGKGVVPDSVRIDAVIP